MVSRRKFLLQMGLLASTSAIGFSGFNRRALALTRDSVSQLPIAQGYGELFPVATENTGEVFLALPKGFKYKVFGKQGSVMSDGNKTPPLHDGMACFSVGNELRLIRNHEVSNGRVPKQGSAIGNNAYDETAGGGTTTLVVNPKTRELIKDFVSLSGTLINCAGGITPWGSWISCEETTLGQSIRKDEAGKVTGGYSKPHGYCYEVFAKADWVLPAEPLKVMGRFKHEAAAVDKNTGIVYLTEDANTAGFYRFIPKQKKHLAKGGELQMLKVINQDGFDTRKDLSVGQTFQVSWVTIDNPDPIEADFDDSAVYKQGLAKGAATFARLEGAYSHHKGQIYFVSTNGGNNAGGQVWRYEHKSKTQGTLTLVFESPSRDLLDMPDNICLKPHSELVFICEDSDYSEAGGTSDNHIRVLAPNGKIADFAKNLTPGFESSEFAGSTFSEEGKTLFVNLQAVGVTLAIWGDWQAFKAD